jgi:RNA 2',3'-cyclic 3'-phosphodiesterase
MSEKSKNDEDTWRIFCAIELPNSLREKLAQHIRRLRETVPQVRASWSRPDNIHLTVKFLGEIHKSQVSNVSKAVELATESLSAFHVVAERTGVFPTHGPPHVVWIGATDLDGQLARLHNRVEDECAAKDFPKETRRFHPHLTLARLRKPEGTGALAAAHIGLGFESVKLNVTKLSVIRSELRSEGSRYTVISTHPLGKQQEDFSV